MGGLAPSNAPVSFIHQGQVYILTKRIQANGQRYYCSDRQCFPVEQCSLAVSLPVCRGCNGEVTPGLDYDHCATCGWVKTYRDNKRR